MQLASVAKNDITGFDCQVINLDKHSIVFKVLCRCKVSPEKAKKIQSMRKRQRPNISVGNIHISMAEGHGSSLVAADVH